MRTSGAFFNDTGKLLVTSNFRVLYLQLFAEMTVKNNGYTRKLYLKKASRPTEVRKKWCV